MGGILRYLETKLRLVISIARKCRLNLSQAIRRENEKVKIVAFSQMARNLTIPTTLKQKTKKGETKSSVLFTNRKTAEIIFNNVLIYIY